MSNIIVSVGDIIKDKIKNTRYRIVAISVDSFVLCEMDISAFKLYEYNKKLLMELLSDGSLCVEKDETIVFDVNTLSLGVRERYNKNKQIMNEVIKEYGPLFLGLYGKKTKLPLKKILEKYSYEKSTFWRMCTRFFQSGLKEYSLVDAKAFGLNKGKTYDYTRKPGKQSEYISDKGILLDDTVRNNFEEALKDYKSGRQKTLRAAYDNMNLLHYSRTEIVDGVASLVCMAASERPTFDQFRYYAKKNITQQEKDLIKTSAMEQRNNKRLIVSDSLADVYGPGDMVEIDACEADVSLVSEVDNNRTIGRPIVYFMIDVYTRIILAVSVAFDNNSILGVTNLFLNLADDKHEYCFRFGMNFDDDAIWPSNIIPRRLRVDRGSEFKSKEFDRICNELGIEKQIVSGGSGSLKGIVEQSFHQMHSRQNVHLENYGLIEKRYDSQHHKEATFNITQYTKMVINFVLMHNQQYDKNYRMTKEMMDDKIQPIPAMLWEYGVKKYGLPRPILEKEQYLYNLMTPVKAKLSRRGISYKDLWYLPDADKSLSRQMFDAGTKKIPFEVRMDMRDVSRVYYIRDGRLIVAALNENLTGNGDYKNLTMKQWEDYRRARKQMDAKGEIHNQEISAYNYAVNAAIVDAAKKKSFSDSKQMRSMRENEKQAISNRGKISKRLESDEHINNAKQIANIDIQEDTQLIAKSTVEKEQKNDKFVSKYSNWDEALEDAWDNE